MSNGLYTPNCIRTYKGQKFVNLLKPDPKDILIEDIAWSLSGQIRFNAHLPVHYSVAQHSCMASYLVSEKWALQALMHHASEAYLTDVAKPAKNLLTNYAELENIMMVAIALKFGFGWPLNQQVHEIDRMLLEMEYDVLMLGKNHYNPQMDMFVTDLTAWDRNTAYEAFIDRFHELSLPFKGALHFVTNS